MSEPPTGTYWTTVWRHWSHVALVSGIVVAMTVFVLEAVWAAGPTNGFRSVVVVVLGLELVVVWRTIDRTRGTGGQRLTRATWVTILRGASLPLLAGFLAVDQPTGSVGWVPAGLYAIAALFDALDGRVARATDSVTELGARLDTEMDGLTVLVGAAVVVGYGLAPIWFLAVGLARYVFAFGVWCRERRGRPMNDLPPSRIRQVLGASAMAVIWVALVPISGGRISWILTTAVAIPFLLNFTYDYLAVSGRL